MERGEGRKGGIEKTERAEKKWGAMGHGEKMNGGVGGEGRKRSISGLY